MDRMLEANPKALGIYADVATGVVATASCGYLLWGLRAR